MPAPGVDGLVRAAEKAARPMESAPAAPPVLKPVISEQDRRKGLAVSVGEGIAAQIHSALTGLGAGGNAVTVGFLWMLGAGDFALGLCAAIPQLTGALQLVSAWLLPRLRQRKRAVMWAATAGRLMFLPAAALPFVLPPGPAALATFLVMWCLANALTSISGNLWVSWMSDLVPRPIRARYFSLRTSILTVAGIAAGLLVGWALDLRSHSATGASTARAWVFAAVFLVASCAALGSFWLLRVQPEPTRPRAVERRRGHGLKALFIRPFQDATRTPALRGVILFVGLYGFSNGFAAPFWQPYQMEALGLSYTYVNGVLVLVQGVLSVLFLPWWGRISARYTDRAVVALCVALASTHPLYYLFATPDRTWPILVDATSAGIAWSGYNFAIFNLVLALAAGPRLESLFAVYATVAGLSQALSSVLTGAVASALPSHLEWGSCVLDRRQVIFLATMMARLACLAVFLHAVPATRPGPIRAVLVAIPPFIKARIGEFKFMLGGR